MICNPDRLRQLLASELPEADELLLTRHVADCSYCREHLEGLAAHRGWWREAARKLRSSQWNGDGTLSLFASEPNHAEEAADESWIHGLAFLEPCDNPAMLGRLGTYDILEVIGSGGFGIVLKGFDRELNRYVAVKVLAPQLAHSSAARKRFAREAQAAAAIVHPHVVPIHAVHATGPLPFLVMPFIPGESLQQRLDRAGPLQVKEVLRIGMQAALGLAAAHAQGLVHRDVKPANILLEHGVDRVMLTDFGLARAMDDASLTRSTVIAGTPQYMSPEQARGELIDCRADLFSLGSVLYASCTGVPPFRGETMLGVLRRVSEETPRGIQEWNDEIPGWMCRVIDRLLAKSPARRFQTAAEVADLLERCLAHVQQPAVLPLPKELQGQKRNALRTRAMRALATAAIVTSLLLCTFFDVRNWIPVLAVGGDPGSQPVSATSVSVPPAAESTLAASSGGGGSTPTAMDWQDSTDAELRAIELILSELERR